MPTISENDLVASSAEVKPVLYFDKPLVCPTYALVRSSVTVAKSMPVPRLIVIALFNNSCDLVNEPVVLKRF